MEVIDNDCGDGVISVYLSPNSIVLNMLNMHSFLYVGHTTIKWLRNSVYRNLKENIVRMWKKGHY